MKSEKESKRERNNVLLIHDECAVRTIEIQGI